jgi:ferrous iron transport protein B
MAMVEDSGYLARAAYLTDAFMARLGLDGRGFVMQLMGFGCNVPAILGTRVMRERKQRLLTMLIIPFSLCSARLQVVVFFSGILFLPQQAPWVLLLLYLLSFAVAIFTAWVFKHRYRGNEAFCWSCRLIACPACDIC